jgi:hypothetical protein
MCNPLLFVFWKWKWNNNGTNLRMQQELPLGVLLPRLFHGVTPLRYSSLNSAEGKANGNSKSEQRK